jgi:hypothetical protein
MKHELENGQQYSTDSDWIMRSIRRRKTMKAVYKNDQIAYLHDHRDGLVDVFAGIILLVMGFWMMTEMFWMGAIMVPLMIPVWRDAKKRITAPRLSHLELTAAGAKRRNATLLMMLVLGFLALLLGLVLFMLLVGGSEMSWLSQWLSSYFGLVIGVIGASLLAAVGALNGLRRFYIYAALTLAIFPAMTFIKFHVGIALIVLGGLIFLSGLIILVRFINDYPILER